MIKDHVLDGVDIVVGSHIRPVQDICSTLSAPLLIMLLLRDCRNSINGKMAHAARPHLGINPIEAASQLITAIGLIR